MALSVKRDGLKHVPWFSLAEWHEVYKQIYSNDTNEQTKGYERLLVWKSRLPKLPVGVECTMSIIEVCLRDRELTPKIERGELPPYYENDLCLIYSTTIMRFLNHVTNIGQTKQSSLFQIAKQLKIPQWIVNIRHDAAHGHELPSISVLRIATNILLEWLHEEYWAVETQAMEEDIFKQTEEDNEPEEVQTLTDLVELWVAIGLYIHAGYTSIKDVPDEQLRETLSDLRTYVINSATDENGDTGVIEKGRKRKARNNTEQSCDENYKLSTAQSVLLSEISRYLSKNKSPLNKDDVVLNVLFEGDAFLPSKEFLEIFQKEKIQSRNKIEGCDLPSSLIQFWRKFITLLQEKEILEKLILRLIKLVNDERENDDRRLIASLWIKFVASSLCKIKLAQQIKHRMEKARENNRKKISSATLSMKVQAEVDRSFPKFKDILWLNVLGEIPSALTDPNFARKIISNLNSKLSHNFLHPLLELVTPDLQDEVKNDLLKFTRIYNGEESFDCESEAIDEVKTIQDLIKLSEIQNNENIRNDKIIRRSNSKDPIEIGDVTIRNSNWTLETDNLDWGNCPFGVLPWQLESMETVDTITSKNLTRGKVAQDCEVVPGMVDGKSLTMKSKINWNSVLGKKKRPKRKRNRESIDNLVDKAIRMVKDQC